jgi:hypothetical protein
MLKALTGRSKSFCEGLYAYAAQQKYKKQVKTEIRQSNMIRIGMNTETNKKIDVCVCGRSSLPDSDILEVIQADLPKTRRYENQEFTAQESGQVVIICRNACCK